jgi:hypothetical protein
VTLSKVGNLYIELERYTTGSHFRGPFGRKEGRKVLYFILRNLVTIKEEENCLLCRKKLIG